MRRGEVWVTSRLGHDRKVIIVGLDALSAERPGVLAIPISDVKSPGMVEPVVLDSEGAALGVAEVPHVGEFSKTRFTAQTGVLAPGSIEIVDMALRVALDL